MQRVRMGALYRRHLQMSQAVEKMAKRYASRDCHHETLFQHVATETKYEPGRKGPHILQFQVPVPMYWCGKVTNHPCGRFLFLLCVCGGNVVTPGGA